MGRPAAAQEIRVDVGGGWGIPINNVDQEVGLTVNGQEGTVSQTVDLKPGPHVYAGLGFVRSIGENFSLGARLRGHVSELRSTVDCLAGDCRNPEGRLRVATVEGRLLITAPGWIHPYFLVGLGVVHTSVDGVTLRNIDQQGIPEEIAFPDVSVVDAGGDVGLGAAFPLGKGFSIDAEFRVAGSLPGGKDNAVTVLPFSLGVSYGIQ